MDPEPGANRDPFIQSKLLNAFDDEFYSDEEDKSLDISLYRNQLLSNTVKPVFFKEDDVSSRGMVIDCLGNDDYSIISYDTEEKSLKRQFKCKFCDKIFDKSCSLGNTASPIPLSLPHSSASRKKLGLVSAPAAELIRAARTGRFLYQGCQVAGHSIRAEEEKTTCQHARAK